ncbi:hypothetical protein GGF40_001698 [Coemansia sp. RSA 1286]|nr:hypothetical protein GGF40_001698 [Coemansia sp. RSA 1286]
MRPLGLLELALFANCAHSLKLAVIGAGAAGASTAYFARQELSQRGHSDAEIHVFESSERIGGRAHVGTVTYNNQTMYYEQGASMFIGKNKHLMDMAARFNLTLCPHPCTFGKNKQNDIVAADATDSLAGYGLWNPFTRVGDVGGGSWMVRQRAGQKYKNGLRMLWRYGGMSDINRVRGFTAEAVDEFLQSYKDFERLDAGVFGTWDEYLENKPMLKKSLYYTADQFYSAQKSAIGRKMLEEVVSLATRVNYMQDIDAINTMGAHISMAAESDEAYSVAGGNWQIFERMLGESGAQVHLKTRVLAVDSDHNDGINGYQLHVRSGSQDKDILRGFDVVIVATPLPLSGIRVLDDRHAELVDAQYVRMHVTFVIGQLRSDLFPANDRHEPLPRLIITPFRTTQPFNCLSILACLDPDSCALAGKSTVLVKVFSHKPLDLSAIFANVHWHHAHTWDAYPRLEPRNAGNYSSAEFDDPLAFSLDRRKLPPIVLDRKGPAGGVYYVNGMETLFSTMESQTVAARHVVRLALNKKSTD